RCELKRLEITITRFEWSGVAAIPRITPKYYGLVLLCQRQNFSVLGISRPIVGNFSTRRPVF
ncbi:hypothetical protein, partial [Microcoleus sp. D2_18a_B4]|uniref:hypothetical protein n=1 Tax=Microcoleus sp. D2_18a_B4 TaxID=3055329 RepID=UPI002FD622D5